MSKKDQLIIRKLSRNDIDELLNLLINLSHTSKKYFHPHPFDKNTLEDICDTKKDHYFVLLLNNRIIGYSFLRLFGYPTPSFGCCICKEFEGKGYGTTLSKWTIDKAKELGYSKVILKTYKENIPAQKIYEKIGFKIVGETQDTKQYKMEINF